MDGKKQLMMEMINGYFDENKFKYTSIDDIVKFCKISKGTFYKIFGTKEDFICELILFSSKEMIRRIESIAKDKKLKPEEKFKEKIVTIEKYLSTQSKYSTYMIEKLSHEERKPIVKMRQKHYEALYGECCIALVEYYGEGIKEQVWELVFLLCGYISEFIQIKRIRNIDLEENYIFSVILNALNIMKDGFKNTGTKLSKSIFYGDKAGNEIKQIDVREPLFDCLSSIKKSIGTNDMSISKTKLLSAVKKIEYEIELNNYDSYMIDAMTALLEKEPFLKNEVNKFCEMKNMIM